MNGQPLPEPVGTGGTCFQTATATLPATPAIALSVHPSGTPEDGGPSGGWKSALVWFRSSPGISRSTPLIVAGILFIAAFLKAHRLLTSSWSADGIIDSSWFQVLLVEVEFAVGLALLLRIRPRLTRLGSLALFLAFVPVAMSRALAGAVSCACFGSIEFTPWATVVLDVLLLLLLFCWRPESSRNSRPAFFGQLILAAGLSVMLAFPLRLRAYMPSLPRLEVSPSIMDLGTLSQAGRADFMVRVRNPLREVLLVEQVHTSCPCLQAEGLPWRFAQGEERSVNLFLDLAAEPEFTGQLLIDYWVQCPDREMTLSGKVRTRVLSFKGQ